MELVGRHLSERVNVKVRNYLNNHVVKGMIDIRTYSILNLYGSTFYVQYDQIRPEFLKKCHPMFKN